MMYLLPDALQTPLSPFKHPAASMNSTGFHLLPPVPTAENNTWLLYLCVLIVKALAAGGGIGGGGMLVPLFLLVAKVPPSRATPLSVIAIAGGAVANYYHYGARKKADGSPLVDYRCGCGLGAVSPVLLR